MLDQKDLETKAREMQRGLQTKLGVQGRDVSHALARAGRRLPARVRREGRVFAQAAFMARNPKMARRLEGATVQTAYDRVMEHLAGIDVADVDNVHVLLLLSHGRLLRGSSALLMPFGWNAKATLLPEGKDGLEVTIGVGGVNAR